MPLNHVSFPWTQTLTDAFHRRIDYLRISLTDRCNLKCIYCMPGSGVTLLEKSALLTAQEIARIVQVAHQYGVRKVRLTGGEPLLRADIIPLISSLKHAIGIRDLSLTTNGMLLAGMAKQLKTAGLDRVNISLDTMDPGRFRTITRGGEISRVWEAIEQAEASGLRPIKINVVPLRGMNDDEIHKFALLTRDKDYHIRFIECMPVKGNAWHRNAYVRADETKARVAALGKLVPLEFKGQGPSRNFRLEGARGVIGFISPVSDHFCRYCNRLRLTATGVLRPCLFSGSGVDLKTPLRDNATDEELGKLIGRAVMSKPSGHALHSRTDGPSGLISMSQIGG
jgi:cyclic pyranopterin phosphate synthase